MIWKTLDKSHKCFAKNCEILYDKFLCLFVTPISGSASSPSRVEFNQPGAGILGAGRYNYLLFSE